MAEDFKGRSEDVSMVDQHLLARLTFNKGKHDHFCVLLIHPFTLLFLGDRQVVQRVCSIKVSSNSSKPLFNQGNPFRILKSISVIKRSPN